MNLVTQSLAIFNSYLVLILNSYLVLRMSDVHKKKLWPLPILTADQFVNRHFSNLSFQFNFKF